MCYKFSPNFQRQFDPQKQCVGAEILMRSPTGNILEIVRYLEKKDQIEILDLLAFKSALTWSRKYQLPCSANFSSVSLAKDKVLEFLSKYSEENVSLELTETIELNEQAANNIKLLVVCGFKLSLDDFGSEHSGLNRLATLPFSEIKIDRFLVQNLNLQEIEIMVGHTINMAHDLGYLVVAEGVETTRQFNILCEMQCDHFQGFLLHKPEKLIL